MKPNKDNNQHKKMHMAAILGPIILSLVAIVHAQAQDIDPDTEIIHYQRLPDLPNPDGVAGPFVGVDGDALLVAGGANFPDAPPWEGGVKVWHDTMYALPATGGEWVTAGKLPRPLAYGVSINTSRGVLCIGGSDAESHYAGSFFLRFVDGNLEITEGPALPGPMAMGCGVRLGDTVYVAGGLAQPDAPRPRDDFWSLALDDIEAGWREEAAWPGPPRMLAVAGALDSAVYLFSGVDLVPDDEGVPLRVYLADAFRFEPGAGWETCAKLPLPAAAAPNPAIYRHGRLYVLGGDTGRLAGVVPGPGHPGFNGIVMAYEPGTDTWKPTGRLPRDHDENLWPPVTTTVTAWAGGHVLPTGEARPGIRTPQVLLLDIGANVVHAHRAPE